MDSDTIKALLNLPWTIQLVLGAGFCAYRIAYIGIRQSHKAIDEIFISGSFGLIAAMVLNFKLSPSLTIFEHKFQIPLPVWAFLATIISGMTWRSIGRESLARFFRFSSYSWNDDSVSAWENLQECKNRPTQLTVETDDGWTLFCSSTAKVGDMPHGPYVLGTAGDVIMYVDQSLPPPTPSGEEQEAREVEDVFHHEWGNMVTYLPKERIRSVKVRYEPVTSRVGKAGWMKALGLRVVAAMRRRLSNDPGQG